MKKQSPTSTPVIASVIQPPSRNFSNTVTSWMNRHNSSPITWTEMCLRQSRCFVRSRIQNRHIDNSESVNVRNTLMEYITTRLATLPQVYSSASNDAQPMSMTPYDIVSRSDNWLNRCGRYESTAILAMTRGPSMNPACPATTRSSASDSSVTNTNAEPIRSPTITQSPANAVARTAFIVRPSTEVAWTSK